MKEFIARSRNTFDRITLGDEARGGERGKGGSNAEFGPMRFVVVVVVIVVVVVVVVVVHCGSEGP